MNPMPAPLPPPADVPRPTLPPPHVPPPPGDGPVPSVTAPVASGPRRRRGRGWVIVGAVIGVLTILWSTLAVTSLLAHRKSEQVLRFAPTVVNSLRVSADRGDIIVTRGAPGAEITVTMHIDEGLASPDPGAEVVGDQLRLSSRCRWWAQTWCSVDYRIEIPAELAVELHSENGDLRLVGLAGPISARAEAGSITGEELSSTTVSVANDVGDIRLAFTGPVESVSAASDIGDVSVQIPDDSTTYHVEASTDVGDRTTSIRSDPTSTRRIIVTTDVGDVAVRYP